MAVPSCKKCFVIGVSNVIFFPTSSLSSKYLYKIEDFPTPSAPIIYTEK